MSAVKEQWKYGENERVFVGTYLNSQNALHWHDDCELIFVERGSVSVTADGESFCLTENAAMFINSGILHRISANGDDALLKTIIFDYGTIKPFADGLTLFSPVLSHSYGIPEKYAELMRTIKEKRPLYAYSADLTVARLMLDIFESEKTAPAKQRTKADARLKSLFAEIRKNYDGYTLADAAKFMNMNKSYLSRFFTQKTGMRFIQYLNAVRVEKAVDMINGGENNITEIAAACGFDTIRNFNRIFKLMTGYAPSALPLGYVFAPHFEQSDAVKSPTLGGCVLVESSADL